MCWTVYRRQTDMIINAEKQTNQLEEPCLCGNGYMIDMTNQ